MEWSRKYSLRSYLRSSLWVGPVLAYVASIVLVRLIGYLDTWLAWSWDWHMEVATVHSVLEGLVAATISFIVFAFSSLLVAIQVASAQLTPRIIATTLLRDPTIRSIVALFVLTLSFALGTLVRSQTAVQYLLLSCAIVLAGASTVAFIYLIDYAARLLRPVSVVWRLGEEGLAVIEQVYPSRIKGKHVPTVPHAPPGAPARTLFHQGRSAILLAVDLETLKREAEARQGTIEFAHQIGDFIAVGEPLFLLHDGAAAADERRLRAAVAFGPERTIEQDATFAFRVIVDIALKALSRAINDPTTAVLAIDQLHRLLRAVGRRHLHDDVIRDAAGTVRLVLRTADWEDFLQLSCREIRLYGADNYQVVRRLRAMLQNLLATLPEARHAAVLRELDLLDRTLDRLPMLAEDLALSRVADLQGLGAPQRDTRLQPSDA
ncbi:DUF2254 domain-containing protein [Reyranella sp.]|jgi:uncharacterized membrane protein|uniref:DUF2254 domain-containing protein n=1 Tax=Reyranella sp. TaxID=1929291 RepID=UPI002F9328B9